MQQQAHQRNINNYNKNIKNNKTETKHRDFFCIFALRKRNKFTFYVDWRVLCSMWRGNRQSKKPMKMHNCT